MWWVFIVFILTMITWLLYLPCGYLVVTVWLPCGYHAMWLTCGYHVVIMWLTCGNYVFTMWLPYGYHVVTMWLPCGLVTMWLTCGYHVVTMWLPCGYHVVAMVTVTNLPAMWWVSVGCLYHLYSPLDWSQWSQRWGRQWEVVAHCSAALHCLGGKVENLRITTFYFVLAPHFTNTVT